MFRIKACFVSRHGEAKGAGDQVEKAVEPNVSEPLELVLARTHVRDATMLRLVFSPLVLRLLTHVFLVMVCNHRNNLLSRVVDRNYTELHFAADIYQNVFVILPPLCCYQSFIICLNLYFAFFSPRFTIVPVCLQILLVGAY